MHRTMYKTAQRIQFQLCLINRKKHGWITLRNKLWSERDSTTSKLLILPMFLLSGMDTTFEPSSSVSTRCKSSGLRWIIGESVSNQHQSRALQIQPTQIKVLYEYWTSQKRYVNSGSKKNMPKKSKTAKLAGFIRNKDGAYLLMSGKFII